jgi:hypothetical protein
MIASREGPDTLALWYHGRDSLVGDSTTRGGARTLERSCTLEGTAPGHTMDSED